MGKDTDVVYLYPNGDMYDGEWRKSRKYGRGVYMYANGQRCAFPHRMLQHSTVYTHLVDEYLFVNISSVLLG